jgi:hypothetical protein
MSTTFQIVERCFFLLLALLSSFSRSQPVSTSVQISGVFLACLLDQVDALYGRIITRDSYGVHAHVLLMFAILQDIVVEKVERLICIHCCLTLTSSKMYMT